MSVSSDAPKASVLNQSSTASPSVREGVLVLPGRFALHFGGALNDVQVAWRLAGNAAGPVVAVLGGISAGRHVYAERPGEAGWWNGIVGPGCSLDSDQCAVLGFDFLGGSGETTGPAPGQRDFPAVSAYDQAALLKQLIAHLHLQLDVIIGASYGGMVALAYAERYPDAVRHIVAISAADRSHPMATAWRSVQRAMVRYAIEKGEGGEGLKLARALAMATYRTPAEFAQRFGGTPAADGGSFRFPVESYLYARGDAYAQRYRPEAFVSLSESIDLHRIEARRIKVPATIIAIAEDQLVPLADVASMSTQFASPCEFVQLSSLYGHDAFLKEGGQLAPIFRRVLDSVRSHLKDSSRG